MGELDELETFVGSKKTRFGAAAIAASDARRVFELCLCDSRRSFSTRYFRIGDRRPQCRNLQSVMEYAQHMEVLFLRDANANAFSALFRKVRCLRHRVGIDFPNFIPDGDQIVSKTYMTRVQRRLVRRM